MFANEYLLTLGFLLLLVRLSRQETSTYTSPLGKQVTDTSGQD